HGSIAEFNGNWYVFYHRSSQNSKFNRRACIEPITFNEDGSINEVEMTTQGVAGPLDATLPVDAYRACLLSGSVHTETVEPVNGRDGCSEHLAFIQNGDWAAYKYIDFKDGVAAFEASVGSLTYGGQIEVRLDNADGQVIGICEVSRTEGWNKLETVSCAVEKVTGVHAVYLVFKGRGGRLFDLESFRFVK
ncbi:MAG: carbohydrate-binding protein, partial [Gorillibacterium sp.]|nr:carbohydrate-binding protein [Gorillibacterium sp.]